MKTLDEVREHLEKLAHKHRFSEFCRRHGAHGITYATACKLRRGEGRTYVETVELFSNAIERDEREGIKW